MLNHDGNLMDAASIAAITALCHFRRPDVGIVGEEIKVVSLTALWGSWRSCWRCVFNAKCVFPPLWIQFSPEERDPIPLSIYHMPISVSFSFFQQG